MNKQLGDREMQVGIRGSLGKAPRGSVGVLHPGWLKQQDFILSVPGGQQSKIRVSPGLVLEAETASVPCLSPLLEVCGCDLWPSLTCRSLTSTPAFIFIWHSPFTCLSSDFPFLWGHWSHGIRTHPISVWLYTDWGFPLDSKESAWNAGDLDLILGQEDPLGKGMATHSSILAWRILWTEEPGGLQFMGS